MMEVVFSYQRFGFDAGAILCSMFRVQWDGGSGMPSAPGCVPDFVKLMNGEVFQLTPKTTLEHRHNAE
jgi:hypothetical protein